MKSKIYLAIIIALVANMKGQVPNSFPWPITGNVGIGTTAPNDLLEVRTSLANGGIVVTQNNFGAACLKLNNLNLQGHNWLLGSLGVGDIEGSGNFGIFDVGPGQVSPNPQSINLTNSRLFISGTTGNVGIGSANPTTKLEIAVSSPGDGLTVSNNSNGESGIHLNTNHNNGHSWVLASLSSNNNQGAGHFTIYDNTPGFTGDRLFINGQSGNVSVGSTSPNNNRLAIDAANSDNALECRINSNTEKFFQCINKSNNVETFQVWGSGNTVIHSTAANPTDHAFVIVDASTQGQWIKNFVVLRNGTVKAREIFVNMLNWPDYVFDSKFELLPLDKLEAYISINHHLPNVPSAAEVDKNGAGLGDLVKIQMEKIEELTLYILELKHEIDELKKKN